MTCRMPPSQERGIQVMVDGRVPTGAGLSSSSAFVCAAAIGLLGVFGVSLTKGEVAEFTGEALAFSFLQPWACMSCCRGYLG